MWKSVLICALVCVSPLAAQTVQPAGVTVEQLEQAKAAGRDAGHAVGTGGWLGGGIASGLLGTVLGAGIAVAIAGSSDAALPAEKRLAIANESQAYQATFAEAYSDEVHSQRKANALAGGIIGTLVTATLVVALTSHPH